MHFGRGGRGRGRGRGGYRAFDSSDPPHCGPSSGTVHSDGSNSSNALRDFFNRADGMNYAMLHELTGGAYPIGSSSRGGDGSSSPVAELTFLKIQPDPFAPGSQLQVKLPLPFDPADVINHSGGDCATAATGDVPSDSCEADAAIMAKEAIAALRVVAAEDFVLRCLTAGLRQYHHSGAIQTLQPSQHVLPRSSVVMDGAHLYLYMRVKLPGHGRRIDGRGALRILLEELLPALQQYVVGLDRNALVAHVVSVLDQEWLRQQLARESLVAFVADGAVLPRAAGDSDLPLQSAVAFASPATLRRSFQLPFSGARIVGMGLRRGLTLIAGGGFHGKSTLLRALELGVYNHVPDDGRTFVVVDPTAVKIRAEDRRSVSGVDISPFISNLPQKHSTTAFSTADASGSTSQAANIVEALELRSHALLMDEDTCATNFMYRDALMAQLVPAEQEPITPFVARVRELVSTHGVSTVMVVGGSSQYFQHADTVIVMVEYCVVDATEQAKTIVSSSEAAHQHGGAQRNTPFNMSPNRSFGFEETFSFVQHRKGGGRFGHNNNGGSTKVSGCGMDVIRVSEEDIRMNLVEQLVEEGQLNAIAQCIAMLYDGGAELAGQAQQRWLVDEPPYPPPVARLCPQAAAQQRISQFTQLVYNCERQLRRSRLDVQSPSCYMARGFTTLPRSFEIGAALNRLRTLRARGI